MVDTTYNKTEDMINKLQSLRGKTKLKFYKKISNSYIEMKNKSFQTEEDPFAKNAQGISKIYHEVLLLMKFLQTKPQVKNMKLMIMIILILMISVLLELNLVKQY